MADCCGDELFGSKDEPTTIEWFNKREYKRKIHNKLCMDLTNSTYFDWFLQSETFFYDLAQQTCINKYMNRGYLELF